MSKPVNFKFRDFNVDKYVLKRYKEFGENFWKPEKQFSDMSLDELRCYVTMFNYLDFSSSMPVKVEYPYKEKEKIRDNLNKEFDRRVGSDFIRLYNLYDSKLNKPEKWTGEIRYKIFSYRQTGHSYTEWSNFIMAYKLLWFARERNIKIDDIVEMFELFSRACYWDLDKNPTKDNILKAQIIEQVFTQDYENNVLKK